MMRVQFESRARTFSLCQWSWYHGYTFWTGRYVIQIYTILFRPTLYIPTIYLYINLWRWRDCLHSCVRSFVWSSLDSIHSVRFGQLLRCAHKRIVNIIKVYTERKNRQLELIWFRKKYRIYPRVLFFEPMKSTRLACLRLDSRYNISMFGSNHFILDTSPLFCAQSSPGKSLPDVHVRSARSNSTIIGYFSFRFWLSRSTREHERTHV